MKQFAKYITVVVLVVIATSISNAYSHSLAAAKIIHIKAKKFEFVPAEITVKKGEPIILELTSQDVRHGFNLPDFNLRADLKPADTVQLKLTPDKTGKFLFTCDVFCGAGHEDMSGVLLVTDSDN